jgi:alpha-N-arabinofuranosidase
MVAAITLNIFNAHADRLGLCCIAQMVNVLQAMILTEGDQMVLTPTYHVFSMYKDHQDAELLESCVFSGNVAEDLKQISASASIRDGSVTVTLANLHATEKADVLVNVEGMEKASVTGTVLAGAMDALNTFQHPDAVSPATLEGIVRTERGLVVPMPACSVVTLKFNA